MGKKAQVHEAQLSFLPPDDADFVHLVRRFLAEASRIYETRTGQPREQALLITSPQDAYEFFRLEMAHLAQEQVRVMTLDVKRQVLSCSLIYQGTLTKCVIRAAELFRPPIVDHAAGIIVCHNHPSGDPTPSREDILVTKDLVLVGELLGITLLDHLVIGKDSFVSMKERGLGF